jgi:hypothetical protein
MSCKLSPWNPSHSTNGWGSGSRGRSRPGSLNQLCVLSHRLSIKKLSMFSQDLHSFHVIHLLQCHKVLSVCFRTSYGLNIVSSSVTLIFCSNRKSSERTRASYHMSPLIQGGIAGTVSSTKDMLLKQKESERWFIITPGSPACKQYNFDSPLPTGQAFFCESSQNQEMSYRSQHVPATMSRASTIAPFRKQENFSEWHLRMVDSGPAEQDVDVLSSIRSLIPVSEQALCCLLGKFWIHEILEATAVWTLFFVRSTSLK